MSYIRTQNPWLLAAGASEGLGNAYANAIVQMAQLRNAQAARQQELGMQQEHMALQRQQLGDERNYRDRALAETAKYHQGVLDNRDEANALRLQLAQLAAGAKDNSIPSGMQSLLLNMPAHLQAQGQRFGGKDPTTYLPYPVNVDPSFGNALAFAQALTEAGVPAQKAVSAVPSLLNPQYQYDVTPAQTNNVPTWWGLSSRPEITPAQTNGVNVIPGVPNQAVMQGLGTNEAVQSVLSQFLNRQVPQQQPSSNAPAVGKYRILSVQ